MDNAVVQLLVLAGIALFLILRLKNVLGTRDGYEPPSQPQSAPTSARRKHDFEVIDGGVDRDITDHVEDGSNAAKALAAMKMAEPGFSVSDFVSGGRAAYEMILMGFERGELDDLRDLLDDDVFQTFVDVVASREDEGFTIEAEFIGVREIGIEDAIFDRETKEAEITLRIVGELSSVVLKDGDVVEGDRNAIKKQKDVWTFSRVMGGSNPNWRLVSTGA